MKIYFFLSLIFLQTFESRLIFRYFKLSVHYLRNKKYNHDDYLVIQGPNFIANLDPCVVLFIIYSCMHLTYYKTPWYSAMGYPSTFFFFKFKVDTWYPSQGVCQEEVQGPPPHCLCRYSLLQRALDHPAPYISFRHQDSFTKVKLS